MMMKRKVIYSVRSHVGLRRANNEDNLFADGVILPQKAGNRPFSLDGVAGIPSIFAVCDGMGGEEAGEVASLAAMEALQAEKDTLYRTSPKELSQAVQKFAERAHRSIQAHTEGTRSGATLALAAVTASGALCFNLGDSRIYCMQAGHFRQVTYDHTVISDQLRRGIRPTEGAQPDRRLTRCIGIGTSQAVEAYPAIKGDFRLLICSDGLSGMVSDDKLASILFAAAQPSIAADKLVQAALEGGGQDNITAIVLDANGVGKFRFL